MKLLEIFFGCIILLELQEFVISTSTCGSGNCQNGGHCVQEGLSLQCNCPCNYTGDYCQFRNWCQDVEFKKIGCFPGPSQSKVTLFQTEDMFSSPDSVWDWYLENVTCWCASAAREKDFRYFSIGDKKLCMGYNSTSFSAGYMVSGGCNGQTPSRSQCSDSNKLIPCIGGSGSEYFYELSEIDQEYCAISEVRDCSDYDYTVRITSSNTDAYFGPILNALPAGKSYSLCLWQRLVYIQNYYMNIISYATSSIQEDHNTVYIKPSSRTNYHIVVFNWNNADIGSQRISPDIFDKWVHVCFTFDFDLDTPVFAYFDGIEIERFGDLSWEPLAPNGKLFIGRDQDKYGYDFDLVDVGIGDFTQLNVWDFVLDQSDIVKLYQGVGTETGNFFAWSEIDLNEYAHNVIVINESPVMRWTGQGCQWENPKCDNVGSCQGGIFRCPCSDNPLAPKSCVSSRTHRPKPCSDYDYFLEFPESKSATNLVIKGASQYTSTVSVCTWLKIAPGYSDAHHIYSPFSLSLNADQSRVDITDGSTESWSRSSTYAHNNWFHLCATKDYQTFHVYVDGVSLGQQSITAAADFIPGGQDVLIGYESGHPDTAFPGSMAHLNVWGIVLDQSVVTTLADGGRTQVGNVLSWPTIKNVVGAGIKVVEPSPKMKWTGRGCSWSDQSCIENQSCEGATYVCPAGGINDIALPRSCSGAPYMPAQQMNNSDSRHFSMNMVLVSRGYENALTTDLFYSSILTNDIEYKLTSLGMNFLALNALTGSLENTFACDTWGNSSCGTGITESLGRLRGELIVLMAVYDSGENHYHDAIPAMQSVVGDNVYITNMLRHREPMTFIGYKGIQNVSWRTSKVSGKYDGLTVVKETIPLIRESCLDHMYMGARKNGRYTIYPSGGPEMSVYCDFTTNGGGWVVLQRRHKGKVPFARKFQEYQRGFGNVDGEFWLGNQNIHQLGRGQLLTTITSQGSNLTYSLYNQFYARSDSSLEVDDLSGVMSGSLFNMNSKNRLKFATRESNSTCVGNSDGGWWVEDDCSVLNLNGQMKRCTTPILSSEIMMRPRLMPRHITMKRLETTMTYKEAMTACAEGGMRLCSSMEICRDGKTPFGGALHGDHYVPVVDDYDRWIQIGRPESSKTCSIVSSPSWGNAANDVKGEVYCCVVRTPASVYSSGPVTRLYVSDTFSYAQAVDICHKKDQQLCTKAQICKEGNSPIYGAIPGDRWTPVSDKYYEWLFIGTAGHPPCILHSSLGSVPDWGKTEQVRSAKGYLFCCPRTPKAPGFMKTEMPSDTTYSAAMGVCREKGRRLCSRDEICPNRVIPHDGVIIEGDSSWIPAVDDYNEWIDMGDNIDTPCRLHTEKYPNEKASWGEQETSKAFRKYLFCCGLIREGSTDRNWKYDLKFHGNKGHVRFPKITPLQTFSACWWMLTNSVFEGWRTVFSHWSLSATAKLIEFAVNSHGGYQLTIAGDTRESKFPAKFVDRSEYHHVCVIWNGLTQSAKVFRDGVLLNVFSNIAGGELAQAGSLLLGQTLNSSTSSDPSRSFRGVITRFNFWDKELNASLIDKYSLVCGEEEGNIIAWPEVKLWISDGVEIELAEACFPASCLDYIYRHKKESGIYQIKPHRNQSSVPVYCNQEIAGGGWAVIGKRTDGSVDFFVRKFIEYKRGFGNLEGEYWLGHERIHEMTSARAQQLFLTGKTEHGRFAVTYQRFQLGREAASYKILYKEPQPSNHNKFSVSAKFSTTDQEASKHNCAQHYGPYWHVDYNNRDDCIKSNLFGKWNKVGNQGAQWFGKDSGKLRIMIMRLRPTEEFKKPLPALYVLSEALTWSSAREFCQGRKSDLCYSHDICPDDKKPKYPFGGTKTGSAKVPVNDAYGKYINIGESNVCNTDDFRETDSDSESQDFKGFVFCCQGFPKQDWRFDLRFNSQSTGHIKTSMPAMAIFAMCWWMQVSPFDQQRATVFTYIAESGSRMLFSYTNNGKITLEMDSDSRTQLIPSVIDGNWHHYCISKHDKKTVDVYFDGEFQFSLNIPSIWTTIIWGKAMVIGQEADGDVNIVSGRGMVGELSQFNMWHEEFLGDSVKEMFQACGEDFGNLLSWSLLKFWIVGDVEVLEGTTCIKPDKHLWYLSEVTTDATYEDIFNENNGKVIPSTEAGSGVRPLTLDRGEKHVRIDEVPDDCVADPGMCRRTGFTIAMWLKREGLVSEILPESDKNYKTLLEWLDEAAPYVNNWFPCYSATGPEVNVTRFHTNCDYKGATVTLVKVNNYIFGGFSNENWGGPARFISSHSSFLFSLHNSRKTGPMKFNVIDNYNETALFTENTTGPVFGNGFDLKIDSLDANTGHCCSSVLGKTYESPTGIEAGTDEAKYFFTSSENFAIEQMEVFYADVPSEAIGIENANEIKDSQMTASSHVRDTKNAPYFARLNNNSEWKTVLKDPSPWLQVKLVQEMWIKKIAIQGCTDIWAKTFTLSFSMDAVSWNVYREKYTEKVFTANSEGYEVVNNTMENAVKTKYVKVIITDRKGSHSCIKIELYNVAKVCPVNLNGALACSPPESTQSDCEKVDCCFVSGGCYSKKETLEAVGIESGVIPDENFAASSWSGHSAPHFARLNLDFIGWKPSVQNTSQWLQVELNKDEMLTHVATQGNLPTKNYVFCKSYVLHYRKKNGAFTVYEENRKPRIFKGNPDPSKIDKHMFLKPFRTRFVRLYPQSKPVGCVRIELYRSLSDFGTTIISSNVDEVSGTGVSFTHETASQYRFAVKSDSQVWELLFDKIPFHWTHFTFTWNENWGLQCFENGTLKLEAAHPTQYKEISVKSSAFLCIGKNYRLLGSDIIPQIFSIMDVFILKRSVLPSEVKAFLFEVSCSFGEESPCRWEMSDWISSSLPTPSNDTGPEFGLLLEGFDNLAFLQETSQNSTHSGSSFSYNSSLAVDGKVNEFVGSGSLTCAKTQPGSITWWKVNLGGPRPVHKVTIFQQEDLDPFQNLKYRVSLSLGGTGNSSSECVEYDYKPGARSYMCNSSEYAQYVFVQTLDPAVALSLCEVAIYAFESENFIYLESSYPLKKGSSSGLLSSQYVLSTYNCLQFHYHMHGSTMGRLNVFVSEPEGSNATLLWRLAGDQGDKWKPAMVKIEGGNWLDIYKVSFEAVVGDGYMSDIAIDNIMFSVDGQCHSSPPAAKVTIGTISKRKCYCINAPDNPNNEHLTISNCNLSSSNVEWYTDGVLQHGQKCLRPDPEPINEGTPLVLSTSCNQADVAFRMTPSGAVQHRKSLLCIQPTQWMNVNENDKLVLGRKGCEYVQWSYETVLVKGPADTSYSNQTVLKLGTGSMVTCSSEDESFMAFIPADLKTTHPGSRVFALTDSTSKFQPATVLEVISEEEIKVTFDAPGNTIVVKQEAARLMPYQPVLGSAILGSAILYTNILGKWIGSRGILAEFWKRCSYLTPRGVSSFTCATDEQTPSLLIIRKEQTIIGGFMNQQTKGENRTGNFLFSIKGNLAVGQKFDDVSDGSSLLNNDGITFGENGQELSLTWDGQLRVENRFGNSFKISDIDLMTGEEHFTPNDFEVLQPYDHICAPRCKFHEVCDHITGSCTCDHTGRPPTWCSTGAASETIYSDADHYWSMDSSFNIFDLKAKHTPWAAVEGKVYGNIGVNGGSIELKNDDGAVELLNDVDCFRYPKTCENLGITISFWFKSIEQSDSDIHDRVFFKTTTLDDYTGYYLFQGPNSGQVIFEMRRKVSWCSYEFHVEPNLWSFLSFSRNKTSLEIFLDGNEVKPDKRCSSTEAISVNSNGKLILVNGGKLCSALFDDFAVWYRKLSRKEMTQLYSYYYKDPRRLSAELEVKFTNLVWNDYRLDKENQNYIQLTDRIHDAFGPLFPKEQDTSFISVGICWNALNSVACKISLSLNGTDYEIIEFLEKQDVINAAVVSSLTTDYVPFEPTVISCSSPEASTIIVEWSSNFTHLYQGFLMQYTNNKTNETLVVKEHKLESTYNLTNLTGFTYYEVKFAVYTLAGVGKWSKPFLIQTEEDIPKHAPGNVTGHNVSSTQLAFSWSAVEDENTYESIRGYVVYVTETRNPLVIVKNITTDASARSVVIDDLGKFTEYTLYIQAYTVDLGVRSLTVNLTTAEDAPDAPPANITVFNSSSTSLRIEFKPVPENLINGILRGYRVFYFKSREGNHTRKNFTIEKVPNGVQTSTARRKRSVDQYHEGIPLFANIYGLQEYTNYTIQIQAFTIKDGVLAAPFTIITGEDLPSMAPPNVTARNTSSTSVLLEWEVMPEDDMNGILQGYIIYYNETGGNEMAYVHRSTSPSVEIQGLQKFTIYGFEVTAFNSIGQSNRSAIVHCQTDQDRPGAPPQDIGGEPTSPVTMGLFWNRVPLSLRHGIILGYRFVFSTMNGTILISKTLLPDQFFISVTDLALFTNYTVNMTAFTSKGDGPWQSRVVLSLQLAPDIAPLNLTGRSHVSLNQIPVSWGKVPQEKTLGYIIGYRLYIKLVSVGVIDVSGARETVITVNGDSSSYVFKDLDFFSKYSVYVLAFTVSGDSPKSNVIYLETCRCAAVLTSQWTNLAPYTNITNPEEANVNLYDKSTGMFPFIINDAVEYCCKTCEAHNYSVVDFTRNEHGMPSELPSNGDLMLSIDGMTDLTFPVYGYADMSVYHQQYPYTPLIQSPGSAFVVRKEEGGVLGVLIDSIFGNWPMFVMMTCTALMAGSVIWILEQRANPDEFPPATFRGLLNGFWWAYVSMTTVGYGDRSPRSIPGRIFAIMWTLTGLVITGILVGDLASSLTVTMSDVEEMIYAAQIGAIDSSPEFRLGIRLNAKMNKVRSYTTLEELQKALLDKEVDGILLDAYVVGTRNDLFGIPELVVNRIKDTNAAYGIVWAGRSSRMKSCLDWYKKTRVEKMFQHIVDNLQVAKKIDKTDVGEEMANLFDPTTNMYTKSLFLSLALLGVALVSGLIYEVIRRRRLAIKIKPKGVSDFEENKLGIEAMQRFFEKSFTALTSDLEHLKSRHVEQLRFLTKRSKVTTWFRRRKSHPARPSLQTDINVENLEN